MESRLVLAQVLLATMFMIPKTDSGAVQLDPSNIDSTIADHQFVFVNFYADWCRFSQMLAPLWDEGADKISKELEGMSVMVGKVDCDAHSNLGTRFHITKYPTIKYIINGELGKKEYRGQRSADGFLEFVRDQIKSPIVEVTDLQELNELEDKKMYMIGYFEKRDTVEHENFKKVAAKLKDSCTFLAGFGDVVSKMHPPSQDIVAFRPSKARSNDNDEAFTGNLQTLEDFTAWVQDRCSPMVREITFENAEELTEEGLPFLILFHHPDDTESIREYNDLVKQELLGEKSQITFLTADGLKFAHPLHHLGKAKEDLPLLAIDSFRHMYLFPKYEDIKVPGKVRDFLQSLYSGKLHREFHYGPDEEDEKDNEIEVDAAGHIPREKEEGRVKRDARVPPDSQFQHLKPSDNRYSFRHDEF